MISSHRSKTQFAKADSRRPRLKLILLLCLLHAVALLAVFLAARAVYGQSSAIEDATQAKPTRSPSPPKCFLPKAPSQCEASP